MTALATATAAWGAPPAWVECLALECDATTQRAAAARIGYSPATVNMVLKGRYAGDLVSVEAAVRAALMPDTVDCPALGAISADDCHAHQVRPFSAVNPLVVRVYRACRAGCPRFRAGGAS